MSTRGSASVVRLGTDGFDDLVISLWANLWPALRRTFSFRLSFGPGDLVEKPPPVLVCTPSVLRARWRDHRLVGAAGGQSDSLAAKLLSGDRDGKVLTAFIEAIGADLTEFNDLPLLEQAYRFAALEPHTIDNSIAGVRLVERLSPRSNRGAKLKAELLDRVVGGLESANAIEVLSLRNLTVDGFEQSSRLWSALERWAMTNSFVPDEDSSFRSVLANVTDASEGSEDWRGGLRAGLSGAARAGSKTLAAAFWRWVQQEYALTRALWDIVAVDEAFGRALVIAAPTQLSAEAAESVLELAREHRLYALHGATVSALYDPADAVRAQLAVDTSSEAAGIRSALRNASPREIVDCAVSSGELRIVEFAAESVSNTPTLLSGVDMSVAAARTVWLLALERNEGAWVGPTEPSAVFNTMLEELVSSRSGGTPLVDRLARTPLADLSDFPRRREVWPVLTSPTLDLLLQATASGWLERARVGVPIFVVEPQLQAAVLDDPKLEQLLEQLANDQISLAVRVVFALSSFDEHRFNSWLRKVGTRNDPIPPSAALEIGRLVQDRHWRLVAEELMHMLRRGREDVRPALRECASVIGWLDRWLYGITPVTQSNKWDSLEEVAAKLYPSGPAQNGLWERAGGSDSDLSWGTNGRTQWRDALNRIRNGSAGPRIADLLYEMKSEYFANDSLRFLADDREFGGWR